MNQPAIQRKQILRRFLEIETLVQPTCLESAWSRAMVFVAFYLLEEEQEVIRMFTSVTGSWD